MKCKIGKALIDTDEAEIVVGGKKYMYVFKNKFKKDIHILEGVTGNDRADFWYNPRKAWKIDSPWTIEESREENKMHVVHCKGTTFITITFGDGGDPYLIGAILHNERKFITLSNMPDVDI